MMKCLVVCLGGFLGGRRGVPKVLFTGTNFVINSIQFSLCIAKQPISGLLLMIPLDKYAFL